MRAKCQIFSLSNFAIDGKLCKHNSNIFVFYRRNGPIFISVEINKFTGDFCLSSLLMIKLRYNMVNLCLHIHSAALVILSSTKYIWHQDLLNGNLPRCKNLTIFSLFCSLVLGFGLIALWSLGSLNLFS